MEQLQNYNGASEKVCYPNEKIPIKTWLTQTSDFLNLSDVNHWHDDYEFCYVIKGNMKQNINGEVIEMNEGNLIFINSTNMHFGFQTEREECQVFCLMLNPSLIFDNATSEDLTILSGNNSKPYMLFSPSEITDKPIVATAKEVHSLVASETTGFKLMESIYRLFRLLIERNSNENTQNKQSKELEIMHRMTGFIQKNYKSKIKLADIAGSGFVCRSKCSEIFKHFLGKTPIEYLTEYRISRSLELMRTTNMNITEIAYNCGFSGASYFAETFIRQTGITPRDYKKRMGN